MIETIFFAMIVIAGLITAFGFSTKRSAFIMFGGILFLVIAMLGMTQGIEKDYGDFVRYVGDQNYVIDQNFGYLSAVNDFSMFALSWLFLGLGFVFLLYSIVVSVFPVRSGEHAV